MNHSGNTIHSTLEGLLPTVRSIGWGCAKVLKAFYHGAPVGDDTFAHLAIQGTTDEPVTAADIAANRYILERIHHEIPLIDVGYISEETYKNQSTNQPLPNPWVWIIDPLDGTRDFIDRTGQYAIHIALIHENRPVLAVVVCPELDQLYYAARGSGTFKETIDGTVVPIRVSNNPCQPQSMTLVCSRTHRDPRFNALLSRLPFSRQLNVGSVGCKVATILEHNADVYISLSGRTAPKDWDMAAPELILTEAGGRFTHFDGRILRYNQGDVNQWGGLIASSGHHHDQLCISASTILSEIDSGQSSGIF